MVPRMGSRTLLKLGEHSTPQPCPSPSLRYLKGVLTTEPTPTTLHELGREGIYTGSLLLSHSPGSPFALLG